MYVYTLILTLIVSLLGSVVVVMYFYKIKDFLTTWKEARRLRKEFHKEIGLKINFMKLTEEERELLDIIRFQANGDKEVSQKLVARFLELAYQEKTRIIAQRNTEIYED